MARSGSLAEWERRLAAQRREDDRRAREQRQRDQEQDRASQQERHEAQQRAADEQSAAVQARMAALEEVLTSALPLPPLSFDRLLAAPRVPDFDPGPLGSPVPAPDWADFASARPTGLSRILGVIGPGARHARLLAEARARFEAAEAGHERAEAERRLALAAARARYHQKVTEERAKAAARNAHITSRRSAFAAGQPGAVEWFAGCVLRASRYPDGFPRGHQVAYRPRQREVAVDFELPPRSVVPAVRGYRYVRPRDAVEAVPRQDAEISRCHERLVAAVALRTLHEIFAATPAEVVASVAFTGWAAVVDPATGQPGRRELVTIRTERAEFDALMLADVDPAACLARLAGPRSPAPPA